MEKKNPCKVEILFHGSANKNIETFVPRAKSFRDPKEGPVVFATPSIALATCFLFEWADDWADLFIDDQDDIYFVIGDKKRFCEKDKGGAIYMFLNQQFYTDLEKGMGSYEWVSKNTQKPFHKIEFQSAYDAMLKFGVHLSFVSLGTLKQIKKLESSSKKVKFINELQ